MLTSSPEGSPAKRVRQRSMRRSAPAAASGSSDAAGFTGPEGMGLTGGDDAGSDDTGDNRALGDKNSPAGSDALPLLTHPSEPLRPVVASRRALLAAIPELAYGTGPVAADTERASGTRYGQATYLIQLRRAGAGTFLVDPLALPDLSSLNLALNDVEYVIHAASQDLPGLRAHGLKPAALFDTEVAGRLLGYPRVALGVLTATLLGYQLAKEHSAEDWSARPLPSSWLRYAALDVELLLELRLALVAELAAAGKLEWAYQEFAYILAAEPPAAHPEPWRRTAGVGMLRNPRQLAVARALWEARETLAQTRDIAPKRLLSDRAIFAAAVTPPRNVGELLGFREFADPANQRRARSWMAAIDKALASPADTWPDVRGPGRGDAPPPPRAWPERRPTAAARLAAVRSALSEVSDQWNVPVDNLLLPDTLKRLCWAPPKPITKATVSDALAHYHARPWQIDLIVEPLTKALKSG